MTCLTFTFTRDVVFGIDTGRIRPFAGLETVVTEFLSHGRACGLTCRRPQRPLVGVPSDVDPLAAQQPVIPVNCLRYSRFGTNSVGLMSESKAADGSFTFPNLTCETIRPHCAVSGTPSSARLAF